MGPPGARGIRFLLPRVVPAVAVVVAMTAFACGDGRGASSSTALVIDPGTALATARPGPLPGPRDPAPYNRRPVLAPVAWSSVGVGQTILFGIDVVDAESDPIQVSLTTHPPSASWTPSTLTVEWTPGPADGPMSTFEVTVVETLDSAGTRRATVHPFHIAVVESPQPAPALPPADVADAELLLTFVGARVAAAALRAPLAAVVRAGFDLSPAELLSRLARVHGTKMLDPSAPDFDSRFALERWQLVAVRLRPGPMLPGASFVYRVPGMAAWIRIRFGARSANAVAQLARDWLLEGNLSGGPRPEHRVDVAAHATAVAGMVSHILDTRASGFKAEALDHAGRLGGGIERDASGAYESGDGWVFWRLGGLPPVVTSLAPTPEGDRYAPRCAPRYDPDSSGPVALAAGLCNAHGLVAVENEAEPGRGLEVETTGASRSFRRTHAVAELGEADLRRIPFGEHGMSCIACHTRTFDWGGAVARRPAVTDPTEGTTAPRARAMDGVFFTFLRPGGPRAGLSALEAYELCELRESLERIGCESPLRVSTGIDSPVAGGAGALSEGSWAAMVELFQMQPSERVELEQFLLQSQVENLFLLGVLEEHGMLPGFFGARESGRLRAALLVAGGRSAVPYVPDAETFQGWNTLAAMVRGGGRLVGAADSVGPLWHALRRRLGGPRPILDRPQFLYRLEREALKPAPRTSLRLARSEELDVVVEAHARMIAEDEGYDPQEMAPKRFRRAVTGRIERQSVWIVAGDDGVRFKVDVSADCRFGVQFAGVYTAPAHRRKGLARGCLADLATRVLERRPRVTLHVDCKNTPAIRAYESVGFVRDMDFRMVVLGY